MPDPTTDTGDQRDPDRAETTASLIEGTLDVVAHAVRQGYRAAVADAIRGAYKAARATPDNPIEGLIRLADRAGVDLDGDGPAVLPEYADNDVTTLVAALGGVHQHGSERRTPAAGQELDDLIFTLRTRNTDVVHARNTGNGSVPVHHVDGLTAAVTAVLNHYDDAEAGEDRT